MKFHLYLWWFFETLSLACNSASLGFSYGVILPNSDTASPGTEWIKAWAPLAAGNVLWLNIFFCLFLYSEITCDNKDFLKPFPCFLDNHKKEKGQIFEGGEKWKEQY